MASVQQIQQMIIGEAQRQGVPPALALAVADEESGFNQNTIGGAGDTGVFQIIPSTAQLLGVDPTDLSQNIRGGVTFLRDNLNQFGGDAQLAVEAYNAGPGSVQANLTHGTPLPPATIAYRARVLKKAAAYQAALTKSTQTGGGAATPSLASKSLPTGVLVGAGVAGGLALLLLLG